MARYWEALGQDEHTMRWMLLSKIHRATVTQADVDYVGSITIDGELMRHAGIAQYELVGILDVTNGARLETYAIEGEAGSGVIQINGAAAHHIHPGDLVILVTYEAVKTEEIENHRPTIIHVDENNQITG